MNRAKPIVAAQRMLIGALVLLSAAGTVQAQTKKPVITNPPTTNQQTANQQNTGTKSRTAIKQTNKPAVAASGGSAVSPLKGLHKFYARDLAKIPDIMTVRRLDPITAAHFKSRAPGDQYVIRQTVLLSKLNPAIQYSYQQTPCNNLHPFWTSDEKYIFFDSNRISDTNSAINPAGYYNIFSMVADGSGVTQIRTNTANEIEPCVSIDGTTLAYVGGGTLTFPNGPDAPTSTGFSLFIYSIANAGTPTNLTINNPSGFVFSDVRHPTYNPGGNLIAFAGQLGSGKPYHIFTVDVGTNIITQLSGPAPGTLAVIESNDTAPAWSPDGNVIAFTSNASGFAAGGPVQATGINPKNQTVAGDPNQYDVWVLTPNQFLPDAKRVTNSSSIFPAAVSSNKNPAWSTLRSDPRGVIPNQPNPGGNTSSENLIAFASTRANANPSTPFQATAVKSTHDIYWMHAQVGPDPKVPGAYTVLTPEAIGNACIKLQTTSPGSTYNPNYPNDPSYQDPTFNFDPSFTSNEDNPTWPQYISSYRIAFQSDRGGTEQLWASTMIDIDAPSLLRYNLQTGEIVNVVRDSAPSISVRQVSAGEKLRFRVQAVDYESGMESVYLQIKDPSSQPQASDQTEHKTYFVGLGLIDKGIQVINAPYELDDQAINPTTYQFHAPGYVPPYYLQNNGPIPNNWPGWNQYVPGYDDEFAFSGGVHPPDDAAHNLSGQGGFWLQLWDDGPINEGGHEPLGEVKGDGIFTNTWVTPASIPSDWLIDVIVRDKALNPFEDATNPNAQTNWKIYDNVWGFTTQPWVGNSGILYVNDYDTGQKFFQSHSGAFTNDTQQFINGIGQIIGNLPAATGSFFLGMFYNGVPTESWMTEYSPALIPTEVLNGTTVYGLINVLTTLGLNAYQDVETQQEGAPNSIPVTAAYDQWRIQCRGPLPPNILNAYLGHIQQQPADVIAGGTGPRSVYVANRCVIWHSPYPGDLFVGPGTILDPGVQAQLASFVQAGGRLMLTGQDLAWGLTLGGGATNALLSSTFQVNYAGDYGGLTINNHTADPPVVAPYGTPLSNGGRGTHPLIMESWYVSYHAYPGAIPDDPPGLLTHYLQAPIPSLMPVRFYSCPNAQSPDEIQFLASSVLDTSDYETTYAETGTVNFTWVTNAMAAPVVGKVAFMSMPMEAINPEYYTISPPTTYVLKNARAEIMHNVGDYLRTGKLVGTIRDLSAGDVPVKGVFIRALSEHRLNADGTPYVYATAITLGDGSYVLDGLDTYGTYDIDTFKSGFVTSHGQSGLFHGGYLANNDIYISEAKPGSISGTIVLNGTTTPAAGLIVVATDVVTGATFSATSGTNGTYTITNVPASNYSVTLPNPPLGNLSTLGYGSCIPSSYGPAPAPQPQVVVTSAANTPNINFSVTQSPGSLTGTVTSATGNPNAGAVLPNATVTATDANGNTFTGITNTSGVYTISNLVPGSFGVVATDSGYLPSNSVNVTIVTNKSTTQNFALVQAKPGGIQGLVSTSLGTPVAGATVTITDAGGNVLDTLTTTAVKTNASGATYNYDTSTNPNVPSGVPAGATVSVAASKPGYTAATPPPNPQSVTVVQATESTGVNFYLNPLETFPQGLSLVSSPYDYSGIDGNSVATLLSIPASDVSSGAFNFITWNTAKAAYVNSPTPPADTFHLGVGYFLSDSDLNTTMAIATLGTAAPPGAIYSIKLQEGWNLIGDPFPFPINFLNLNIMTAGGLSESILAAQTGTNPVLGGALWGFQNNTYEVSYTLDPWVGYWIRAFAPITLLVDPSQQQNRSAASKQPQDARFAITSGNSAGEGWKVQLSASAGAVNAPPAIVGVTRGAINGYDEFKLEEPPTVGKTNVSVVVNHPEWSRQAGQYAVDLRSPANTSNSWNLVVTSNVPNQPVVLTWPQIATVSAREDLILTDTDTNTTINLRTASNYTIPPSKLGITRHFTLTSVAASRVALQIASINAHPVGGSASRGVAPTAMSIGYTLTAPARTQVNILKGGHVIRTIEAGVTREAGDATLVWDLKNSQGVGVPADAYVLEVQALDAQGHLARQITPLVVPR